MRTGSLAIVAGLLGIAPPLIAAAAPLPSAADRADARAAAQRGERLFNAKKYRESIAAFEEADRLFHAPTFLLMIARAQDKLGELVEARATYQKIVDEDLPRASPPPFVRAQRDAKGELAALSPRIPTLEVRVTGAPADRVRLTIDRAAAPIGEQLPRNPGEHIIIAAAPGDVIATRKITLEERARERVTLDLEAARADDAPGAPPSTSAPAREGPAPGPAEDTVGAYTTAAAVSFVMAGVALGVGAVTGALSSDRVGVLRDKCPNKTCYDNVDETYSSARTLATASTISFAVGAAATVGGIVFLVLDRGDGDEPASTAVAVGPAWLGVRGGF